jgi:hypothetical protein
MNDSAYDEIVAWFRRELRLLATETSRIHGCKCCSDFVSARACD